MGKFIDLTGNRYGYLTVIKRVESSNKRTMWLCQCDCGNQKIIRGSSLKSGMTKSCGCMKNELNSQSRRMSNNNDFDHNRYEFFDDYVVGYTSSGNCFFIDVEDYKLVKNYTWSVDSSGYIKTNTGGFNRMHRLVMGLDDCSDLQVDHINHNKADNRKCNLRVVTISQNLMNRNISSNNSSGYRGISFHNKKKKWISQIQLNGRLKYLGIFSDIKDAINARLEAEKKYFSDYNYNPSEWNLVEC